MSKKKQPLLPGGGDRLCLCGAAMTLTMAAFTFANVYVGDRVLATEAIRASQPQPVKLYRAKQAKQVTMRELWDSIERPAKVPARKVAERRIEADDWLSGPAMLLAEGYRVNKEGRFVQ